MSTETETARCYCGNPTERSVILMCMRFAPPPPDEPRFQSLCCDVCHDLVLAQLEVERAAWHCSVAATGLRAAEMLRDASRADYRQRQEANAKGAA